MSERATIEIDGHVMVITMTRHEKRNAIDGEMTSALDEALNRLDDDPDLWVGIITGGPDMFCAGTDMAATSGSPTERGGVYGVVGRTRTKPLIAAVEGVAFGGGFEVVMACDMVVAAENARFGLPEVKWGLYPFGGAAAKLATQIGYVHAMNLLLTAENIDANEALRVGLVNELLPAEDLMDRALATAGLIAANSPMAVQAVKQFVSSGLAEQVHRREAREQELGDAVRASADFREGIAAFRERREPDYK